MKNQIFFRHVNRSSCIFISWKLMTKKQRISPIFWLFFCGVGKCKNTDNMRKSRKMSHLIKVISKTRTHQAPIKRRVHL